MELTPKKWPYKWVTGVITPISGVITLLITGRGPTCATRVYFCWYLTSAAEVHAKKDGRFEGCQQPGKNDGCCYNKAIIHTHTDCIYILYIYTNTCIYIYIVQRYIYILLTNALMVASMVNDEF